MEEIKILTAENLDEILNFEMERLPGEGIEREISSWHAPWRKEALEHYIPRGWSFVKRVDNKVVGYVIAQPLLFFKSWTQVLWIEHVNAETEAIGVEMIMIAYRWAKDKHLQKVYFGKNLPFSNAINFCNVNEDENLIFLNTTRM